MWATGQRRGARARSDGVGLWVFPGGTVERLHLPLELERVDQRIHQEVAGAEVACAGADAPAGDEFERGARWRRGPAIDVQSHAQDRAQWSPGQAHLDPACTRAAIVLDRPAQPALADVDFAVVSLTQQALKCGHARVA